MCIDIMDEDLTSEEMAFLVQHKKIDNLEELWHLMDLEWEKHGADYNAESDDKLADYYRSPVWLLNGIFSECDPESQRHREAIADWIKDINPLLVVDYGGGFGTLARKIATRCPETEIIIVEPHPTTVAMRLSKPYRNIHFSTNLPGNADIIIAQDVLEHVHDPLAVYSDLTRSIRSSGYFIAANCFHPVTKCHIPSTFHLRYTFRFIASSLGYQYQGIIPSVHHAQIFKKKNIAYEISTIRRLEAMSKVAYPVLNAAVSLTRPPWRLAKKYLFK
jgi:2-polyprenyl-6-hydroxyphenyl methylase/3-demethylubiquinone-9 3-methyltransferase